MRNRSDFKQRKYIPPKKVRKLTEGYSLRKRFFVGRLLGD